MVVRGGLLTPALSALVSIYKMRESENSSRKSGKVVQGGGHRGSYGLRWPWWDKRGFQPKKGTL